MVVDPDRLSAAAREVEASSGGLARDLDALKAAVVSTGSPWGQDEPGTLFGQAYVEMRQLAIDAYDSHVKLLARAAENLSSWATSMSQNEENLTLGFDRVRPGG